MYVLVVLLLLLLLWFQGKMMMMMMIRICPIKFTAVQMTRSIVIIIMPLEALRTSISVILSSPRRTLATHLVLVYTVRQGWLDFDIIARNVGQNVA